MSILARTLRMAKFAKPLNCPLCKSNRINGANFYRCGSTDYVQSEQCSENCKKEDNTIIQLLKEKDKEIADMKCVVNHLDKKISDLIKHFGITTEQLIDMLSNEKEHKNN